MDAHIAQALLEIADDAHLRAVREGRNPAHDDAQAHGQLAMAAACFAAKAAQPSNDLRHGYGYPPPGWPWPIGKWKPQGQRLDLVRAAVLIVAELARLQRAAGKPGLLAGRPLTSERVDHIVAIGLQAPEALAPDQVRAVCAAYASAMAQQPDKAA